MSRELKRVPKGFPWPRKVWFGYVLDPVPCQLCSGHKGKRPHGPTRVWWDDSPDHAYDTEYCECCEGAGVIYPKIEIPQGDAYQMWETTSDGSPISPTFDTPEELAHWLADNNASACGDQTATYEQWLAMIGQGWAPTMVGSSHGLQSGVEAAGRKVVDDDHVR